MSLKDLHHRIIEKGDGPILNTNQRVEIDYTAWLGSIDERRNIFDSTKKRGETLTVSVGVGEVVQGLDILLGSVPVGSTAIVAIPPKLAYGPRGLPGLIGPNETVYYEVHLIKIVTDSDL